MSHQAWSANEATSDGTTGGAAAGVVAASGGVGAAGTVTGTGAPDVDPAGAALTGFSDPLNCPGAVIGGRL